MRIRAVARCDPTRKSTTVPITISKSPAELGGMTRTLTEQWSERLTPRSRAVEIQ